MHVGKKLAVVLSVMITGVSAAMFFRKDASPLWFWSRRSDDPFAQQVERRVGQATWTAPQAAASRVPLATAAITPSATGGDSAVPHYSGPVGSLLAPIDGVVEDADSGRYEVGTIYEVGPVGTSSSSELRHRVEDGDTLTKLAVRYLGRAEAFREIYELNRAMLADPDLLPIGAVLRIPARGHAAPAVAGPDSTTGMVPVPPRPGS